MDEKDKIINVPVEDILPNRFQPRLAFDEHELNELSNSILRYGVLQPIILRKIGDKYEIIAGERRYKATVQAGLKTIPAIINNSDDNRSAEIALLENLQRKNLSVIEEAQSFKKLLDRGFTQDEIANKLGVSQSSVANKIRLLNLPRKVQDALLFNKISERHARSLISLNDKELQEKLLDRIIAERLTVRQTEDEINKLLNNYTEEDDIPVEVRKYIDREGNDLDEEVPDVVEIKNNDEVVEDEELEDISPYQTTFKDNIKKIEDEIDNQQESFYDEIINKDFNNNRFSFLNTMENRQALDEINHVFTGEKEEEKVIEDIPTVISKVRSFVSEFDNKNINTQEEDLPDKYKIIIEIKKDN